MENRFVELFLKILCGGLLFGWFHGVGAVTESQFINRRCNAPVLAWKKICRGPQASDYKECQQPMPSLSLRELQSCQKRNKQELKALRAQRQKNRNQIITQLKSPRPNPKILRDSLKGLESLDQYGDLPLKPSSKISDGELKSAAALKLGDFEKALLSLYQELGKIPTPTPKALLKLKRRLRQKIQKQVRERSREKSQLEALIDQQANRTAKFVNQLSKVTNPREACQPELTSEDFETPTVQRQGNPEADGYYLKAKSLEEIPEPIRSFVPGEFFDDPRLGEVRIFVGLENDNLGFGVLKIAGYNRDGNDYGKTAEQVFRVKKNVDGDLYTVELTHTLFTEKLGRGRLGGYRFGRRGESKIIPQKFTNLMEIKYLFEKNLKVNSVPHLKARVKMGGGLEFVDDHDCSFPSPCHLQESFHSALNSISDGAANTPLNLRGYRDQTRVFVAGGLNAKKAVPTGENSRFELHTDILGRIYNKGDKFRVDAKAGANWVYQSSRKAAAYRVEAGIQGKYASKKVIEQGVYLGAARKSRNWLSGFKFIRPTIVNESYQSGDKDPTLQIFVEYSQVPPKPPHLGRKPAEYRPPTLDQVREDIAGFHNDLIRRRNRGDVPSENIKFILKPR